MRWGLTSNVRTLMIAAPAREIVSKVSCEPLYQPAEVQCPNWVICCRSKLYHLNVRFGLKTDIVISLDRGAPDVRFRP